MIEHVIAIIKEATDLIDSIPENHLYRDTSPPIKKCRKYLDWIPRTIDQGNFRFSHQYVRSTRLEIMLLKKEDFLSEDWLKICRLRTLIDELDAEYSEMHLTS